MKPRIQIAGRRPKKSAAKRSIYKSLPRIVYVIELDPAAASVPQVAQENPGYISGPCLYVGSTNLTAEERFQQHATGHKNASSVVGVFARFLRSDLMPPQKPIRKDRAIAKEFRLARELRARGFAVWQR